MRCENESFCIKARSTLYIHELCRDWIDTKTLIFTRSVWPSSTIKLSLELIIGAYQKR